MNPDKMKHIKQYVSVLTTTALSGALTGLVAAFAPGVPSDTVWKVGVAGAIAGAASALKHLFDEVPGDRPSAVIGELITTGDILPAKVEAKS